MLEPNNIYLGDCLELMKQMPDKSVDLVLTDPPYGIGMDNSNKRTKPDRPNSYTQYPDFRYPEAHWDSERIGIEYFNHIFRISRNQMIFGANYYCNYLPNGYGWVFWDKQNGDNNCFSDGEFIFSSKGIQSKRYVISNFNGLMGGKAKVHTSQKPTRLMIDLIIDYSEENDLVLDPFLGSGTTAVACIKTNRRYIGMEIDPTYFEIAKKRIDLEKQQLKLELV